MARVLGAADFQSGRGLPHSTTLTRGSEMPRPARFGVRLSPTALALKAVSREQLPSRFRQSRF